MELKPNESRSAKEGFLHPDCLKCVRYTEGCPLKVPEIKR